MTTSKLATLTVFIGAFISLSALAQETNGFLDVPPTKLDAFATNVDTVIIRAATDIGTVSANNALLTIRCVEMAEPRAGRREYGLGVEIAAPRAPKDTRLVDYDELDSFLTGLDYLGKVDWSVTTLNSFHASYATKSGLRLDAFSSKRSGYIEYSLHDLAVPLPGILLTRDQMVQFFTFIEQARTKLDSVRGK